MTVRQKSGLDANHLKKKIKKTEEGWSMEGEKMTNI